MKKVTILSALAAVSFTMNFTVQAAFTPETILPENTLALLVVRDIQKDCAEFKTSPLGLLFKDPAMKPFCDYVEEQFTQGLNEFDEILAEKKINLTDYQDLFKGGAALTLTSVKFSLGEKDGKLDLTEDLVSGLPLFIAEFNDGPEKLKTILDDLQSKLEITFGVNKVGNTEFRIIPLGDDGEASLWLGANGSLLYGALAQNEPKDIAATTDSLSKILKKPEGQKALAETDLFKASTNITPDRDFYWIDFTLLTDFAKQFVLIKDKEYVAPKDIMEAMMALPRPLAMFYALGLSALKSISGSAWTENGEAYTSAKIICPANERRGITALIDTLETTDCGPAEFIPSDPITYTKAKLNVKKFWDIIDSTSTEVVGGMKMMVLAGLDEKLKTSPTEINLQKALLDNLTGEIIILSYPSNIEVKDFSTPDEPNFDIQSENGSIFLLGIKDTDKFISTAQAIIDLINPGMSEDIMKFFHKMDGYIVIGVSSEKLPQVKAFLEAKGKAQEKSLAKCPVLQEAAAKIGGFEGAQFTYCNLKGLVSSLYTYWDQLKPVAKANQKNGDIPEELIIALDKLPAWADIEKYFGITIGNMKVTSEGIESISYTPWPKTLEK